MNSLIITSNPSHKLRNFEQVVLDTAYIREYYGLPTTQDLMESYRSGITSSDIDIANKIDVAFTLWEPLNAYHTGLDLVAKRHLNFYSCNATDAINTDEQRTHVAYFTILTNGLDIELRKYTTKINISGIVKVNYTYALTMLGTDSDIPFPYRLLEDFGLPPLQETRLMGNAECMYILNKLVATKGSIEYLDSLDTTAF